MAPLLAVKDRMSLLHPKGQATEDEETVLTNCEIKGRIDFFLALRPIVPLPNKPLTR